VLNNVAVTENIKQGRERKMRKIALKRILQNCIFVEVNIRGGRKQFISHEISSKRSHQAKDFILSSFFMHNTPFPLHLHAFFSF
jgi:hypothetical protein